MDYRIGDCLLTDETEPEFNPAREDGRWPGFETQTGRKPVAGQDFSDDAPLCQDDYEFFTGTGRYYEGN